MKHPKKMLLPAGQNGLLRFVPDELYLKAVFKAETGYRLDLKHPRTYNEKLQWIKLYDRRPEYRIYADKYRVRDYIDQKIGAGYLVPLIGVYKSPEEIPWINSLISLCSNATMLPEQISSAGIRNR